MSILRVTVRSVGPANSTEQLKIRLREATANMVVNENMEATDKQRKSRVLAQMIPKAAPERPLADGSSTLGHSISSLSYGTSRVSPRSRSTHSPKVLVRKPTLPLAPRPPDRAPLQVRVHNKSHAADSRCAVTPRNAENMMRIPVAKPQDTGEYSIQRSRRETRKADKWEVIRKSRYAYWPPTRPRVRSQS